MTDKGDNSGTGLDRRTFLKRVAATGATGAIGSTYSSFAAQSTGDNKTTAKSWRDKPDPIDESLISDGGIYDVVVVGGGHAGLFCARVAAMKGASVAVIENQAENSYTRGVGGGQVGTVNSQFMLDQGAPRIDESEFLREWARRNVIRHNPRHASYFVKNSGKVLDWIIKEIGKESLAQNCHGMSCPPKPTVIQEVSGWKFYYGTAILKNVWQEALKIHQEKAMSDGAKWYLGHHAEICDLDDSGAVTGLIAKRSDGKYVRFRARKGVALCAGDFSNNREMVIDILDDLRHQAEARGDLNLIKTNGAMMFLPRDGYGIKMGIWAGGHLEVGPRSTMGDGDPGTGPWFMQLDHKGERFCDEAAGTTLAHPIGSVIVTLYDSNWKKVLEMRPPHHMAPDTSDTVDWQRRLSHLDNLTPGPISKNWVESKWQNGIPGVSGTTCCAKTIEELIDYMGCYKGDARKKALAEIARYNGMCKNGVDEDFGKDPSIMKATGLKDPLFYGTVTTCTGKDMFGGITPGMVATTGLDVDAEGRVLDSNFKPIKGLYAAGNNAGGRYIVVYQSPFAGISIGMAVTDGYLLGERLAGL